MTQPPLLAVVPCYVPHLLLDTGALKTTGGKAEVPSLAKEGWLRPLRKCRGASLAGADGVVGSSHRLSEVERTTPAAPSKEWDHLLDGTATPPLPRRGLRLSRRLSQTPVSSGRLVGNAQAPPQGGEFRLILFSSFAANCLARSGCLTFFGFLRHHRVRSLRSFFRRFFGGPLFFGSSSSKNSRQAIIPLVTRVLIQRPLRLLHRNLSGPGFRPSRRIFDRELIEQRVHVDTRETFDQTQVLAGSSEVRFIREIGCFDDQRVAVFPMATRVSQPLADVLRKMRATVQWDDSGVVNHLHQDHNRSRSLHNLVVAVVVRRKHWRSSLRHRETTLGQRSVLRTVEGATSSSGCLHAIGVSPLRLRRQRWNSSVRRVDNQRSSHGGYHFSSVSPELVVRAADVGVGGSITAIPISIVNRLLFEFGRFRFG